MLDLYDWATIVLIVLIYFAIKSGPVGIDAKLCKWAVVVLNVLFGKVLFEVDIKL